MPKKYIYILWRRIKFQAFKNKPQILTLISKEFGFHTSKVMFIEEFVPVLPNIKF